MPGEPAGGGGATIEVPADHETIQDAVDAAAPGDLILVSPGVYNEAVNVTTPELTIRGLDRNEVILDGEFELDNGIRVLGAGGVAIENMTARNYTFNGFFWTGVDGYRGSYLTAYRNGDYGVYAFDSVNGLFEHSYAAGSPDAGFYIGQCYPCDAVIDDVHAEHNGLGYSGTNSGGNLLIVNSRFNNNRAGIVPNSGSYELCYPQRESTIVGNLVYSNNQPDTPAIDDAILAMGNGIAPVRWRGQHDLAQPRLGPRQDRHRPRAVPRGAGPRRPAESGGVGHSVRRDEGRPGEHGAAGTAAVGCPRERRHRQRRRGQPDRRHRRGLGIRRFNLGQLLRRQHVLPRQHPPTSRRWRRATARARATGPLALPTSALCSLPSEDFPPSVDFEDAPLPELAELENMPDAATAPAAPATDMPPAVDLDAIAVPDAPTE